MKWSQILLCSCAALLLNIPSIASTETVVNSAGVRGFSSTSSAAASIIEKDADNVRSDYNNALVNNGDIVDTAEVLLHENGIEVHDDQDETSGGVTKNRKLQSSSPRVIAEVFECNEANEPVRDTTTPRKMGYEIKLCFKPNTPTRNRDVLVQSVQKFTFFRNQGAAVQHVVRGGNEANEELSLVLCIPGAEICSFKTKMADSLFYGDRKGNVTGVGEIGMQFGQTAIVQNAVNDFAGFSTVSIIIPVVGVKDGLGGLATDDEGYNWWRDAPIWLRLLIILAIIILVLICCCICGGLCCWLGGCCESNDRIRRTREVITKRVVERYENTHDVPENEKWQDNEPDEFEEPPPEPHPMLTDGSEQFHASPFNEDDAEDDDDGPTDNDVCFDAEEHPGTVAFEEALDKVVAENPKKKYGPPIYRAVKKQLPGRRFYVCDDEEHPDEWREIDKQELIDEIGKAFNEGKKEYKKNQGALVPT